MRLRRSLELSHAFAVHNCDRCGGVERDIDLVERDIAAGFLVTTHGGDRQHGAFGAQRLQIYAQGAAGGVGAFKHDLLFDVVASDVGAVFPNGDGFFALGDGAVAFVAGAAVGGFLGGGFGG